MLFGLMTRSTFELNVLKDRAPPFVQLSDGRIQNGYTLKLINKRVNDKAIHLTVDGLEGAEVSLVGEDSTALNVTIEGEQVERYRLVIKAPAEGLKSNQRLRITATDTETGEADTNLVPFSSIRN